MTDQALAIRHRRSVLDDGIVMHFVVAGSPGNPAVVLLHGWPQSWFAWRHLIPHLAGRYRVLAPDLRGFGDSSKPMTGYDTLTVGGDVVQLLDRLGIPRAALVGHDFGAAAAYAVAAQWPERVSALAVLDMLIPGFGLEDAVCFEKGGWGLWHLPFHAAPDIPEMLIAGREREYLGWFFRNHAYNPSAITASDLDVYVENFRQAGALRAAMGYYRALHQDAEQNRRLATRKLAIPVLAVGGAFSIGEGVGACMQRLAESVTAEIAPDCGHWVAEEQPNWCLARLLAFLGAEVAAATA